MGFISFATTSPLRADFIQPVGASNGEYPDTLIDGQGFTIRASVSPSPFTIVLPVRAVVRHRLDQRVCDFRPRAKREFDQGVYLNYNVVNATDVAMKDGSAGVAGDRPRQCHSTSMPSPESSSRKAAKRRRPTWSARARRSSSKDSRIGARLYSGLAEVRFDRPHHGKRANHRPQQPHEGDEIAFGGHTIDAKVTDRRRRRPAEGGVLRWRHARPTRPPHLSPQLSKERPRRPRCVSARTRPVQFWSPPTSSCANWVADRIKIDDTADIGGAEPDQIHGT